MFSIIPVLTELRGSALISAKECEDIAQDYDPHDDDEWQTRLLRIAVSKESHIITKIITVVHTSFPSEIFEVLKGMLCFGGVLTMRELLLHYCLHS